MGICFSTYLVPCNVGAEPILFSNMSDCESISSVSETDTSAFQGTISSVQFVVPLHYEDLTLPAAHGRFTAKIIPDAQLQPYLNTLQDIHNELQHDPVFIADNKLFDPIYTFIGKWNKLNAQVQKKITNVLCEGLNKLVHLYSDEDYNVILYKNCLKIFSFLLSSLITKGEVILATQGSDSIKNLKSAKAAKSNDEQLLQQAWQAQRERILSAFLNMCKSEKLSALWSLSSSKDLKQQIGDLIFRSTFLLLENPQNLKCKVLREICIKILTEVISSFEIQIEATNFFMQSLMRIDSKTYPIVLAELLGQYQQSDFVKGGAFIGGIVREIGKLEGESFGKDSTSSKSIGLFLESLAENAPSAVLANISVLLPHLDLENYMIRNGVVQLIGKLLLFLHKKVVEEREEAENSSKSEEERPERPKSNSGRTRDSLLEILLDRVNDVSSYTRSKVMQTWKELADNNSIPVKGFALVCNAAIERLDDKSLIVSKSAIQLLTSLLQNNPFGPHLRLSEFRAKIDNQTEEMSKKEALYCKFAVHFLEIFDMSMEKILAQLSRGITSIMECIELIKVANQFQIQDSEKGLRRLLPLVVSMSKETDLRDAIVNAYAEVFVPEQGNPRHSAANLIKLALSVSFSEKKCLALIISELARTKRISKPVMSAIWEIFSVSQTEKVHLKRGSLEIISMIGQAHASVISTNLQDILQEVFSPLNQEDEVLVRTVLAMIHKLDQIPVFDVQGLSVEEFIFQKIEDVLLSQIAQGPNWYGAAEQALNVLFKLHHTPSEVITRVLEKWTERSDLRNNAEVSSNFLSKIFFIVGHTSLKLFEQIDYVRMLINFYFLIQQF